jgi:RNase P/RNase MRP subunit p29
MLIGKRIAIRDATNPTLIGTTGTVIDETTNTIIIHHTKDITIIKHQIITIEETP